MAREFDRVCKRSHFSYWNTYPKQRARVRGARLRVLVAGLATAYLLVSYAARQRKENSKSRPRSTTLQASLAPGFRGRDPYEIDDSLPGWHLDGICVAAYEPHIGLLRV